MFEVGIMESRSLTGEAVAAGQKNREKQYWLNNLAGFTGKTGFPFPRKKLRNTTGAGDAAFNETRFTFTDEMNRKLLKLSNNADSRLFMILVAALTVLLKKYTGKYDIVLGCPVLKQDIDTKFINTVLPLRCRIEQGATFKDLLLNTKQTIIQATENQNYPLKVLLNQLNLPYSEQGFVLFDTAVLLENIHKKSYIMHLHPNIIFSFSHAGEQVVGDLEYNSQLYEQDAIRQIANHYNILLEKVLENVNLEISRVDILSAEERRQLLEEFNDTRVPFPSQKTMQQLFEEQAARTPGNLAVVGTSLIAPGSSEQEQHTRTYGELNERANRLAALLRTRGIGRGTIVGIIAERSLDTITGLLGILKAGGAYLPIDPAFPHERVKYMLADSNTNLLLTQNPPGQTIHRECEILDLTDAAIQAESDENPEHLNQPGDLAYIMFTSGSTGKPKGVMIEHRQVIAVLARYAAAYNPGDHFNVLQLTGYTFDPSVEQAFGALFNGAAFFVVPMELLADVTQLRSYIQRNRIHIINFVPSLLDELLCSGPRLESIKYIISGGDKLDDSLKDKIIKVGYQLYNHYGPTETCIDALAGKCSADQDVTLGKPIDNTRCYVLDKDNALVPIGITGELCIAGDGVGRGYLNNPELSAEKFIPNPFEPGQTLYKTGDLAQWTAGGEFQFMGRLDRKVKVRGFRIEPEEIEAVIKENPSVEEAAVIVKDIMPTADPAEIERCLVEVEGLSTEEVQRQTIEYEQAEEKRKKEDQGEKDNRGIHILNTPDFEITLKIKNHGFIKPPQEYQANWNIRRLLEEFGDDLAHLDKQAARFVEGTGRIEIDEDWKKSQATYDGSQLIIDEQQVMQDWQHPLMKKMATIAAENHGDVLEVGFGMGISATYMMEMGVKSYSVIECNEGVIKYFNKWRERYPDVNIRLIEGMWQDVTGQLEMYDSIFFDTYPLSEEEFFKHVINSVTFAEHFFPTAYKHLRKGGVFTYYTNEIDTYSRRHQQLVFKYFDTFSLSVVKPLQPPPDCKNWWADSMVAIKAVK